MTLLNEHPLNLLPSLISPRTASAHNIKPIGKLPTTLVLQGRQYHEEMHIFQEVPGVMISWKACKALGILPANYPVPLPTSADPQRQTPTTTVSVNAATIGTSRSVTEQLRTSFPTVFDGQIRVMQGEEFHIAIEDTAKPFCV